MLDHVDRLEKRAGDLQRLDGPPDLGRTELQPTARNIGELDDSTRCRVAVDRFFTAPI